MNNGLLWSLLWIVTLGAAFFVGQSLAGDGGATDDLPSDELAVLRQENERLRGELSNRNAPLLGGRDDGERRNGGASTTTRDGGDSTNRSGSSGAGTLSSFRLAGHADPDIAVAEFLDYARTMLARGEEGHLQLLRTFDAIQRGSKGQAFRRLFGDDFQSSRFLYEVMRFGVEHERQVAAMTETIFRAMANDPDSLSEFDDDSFEVFTEGIALPMPAIVDRATMDRLRGYARTVMEKDRSQLPKSLRNMHRHMRNVLRAWAPLTSLDDASTRLSAGNLPLDEATALLRRMSKEQLKSVDVVSTSAKLLESGDSDILNYFENDRIVKVREQLDPYVLKGMAQKKYADHQFRAYLVRTGRGSWDKARPLIDEALKLGGGAPNRVLAAAVRLRPPPDSDWIRWALDHYALTPAVEKSIRDRYKLGK